MSEVLEVLGMTKEKAISELESVIASDDDIDFFTRDEKMAMELAISALKGGWIPIEERNPKCCGVYYVTRLLGDGFEEQYITDASFFDGSNKWYDDNRINHDRDYLDDVVAWFEAEPYKKGE